MKSAVEKGRLGKFFKLARKLDYPLSDLRLTTNQRFEKSLKSVNLSYSTLIRGIEKREINLMTNYKPNTKDEMLASQQPIKTVSLNLY